MLQDLSRAVDNINVEIYNTLHNWNSDIIYFNLLHQLKIFLIIIQKSIKIHWNKTLRHFLQSIKATAIPVVLQIIPATWTKWVTTNINLQVKLDISVKDLIPDNVVYILKITLFACKQRCLMSILKMNNLFIKFPAAQKMQKTVNQVIDEYKINILHPDKRKKYLR